ncbi:folylpolyglutamate synthase, mitochondrial [Trichuris trichiura]|uniref:tetrahydrofolate synthase n=1 Tax=Trichuris trichiura TaxID=36087 RepID=A0A077Z6Y6_TRITR|nr:folylpolyglutamate synthase, mitochondrial [Trichuris trichiura]
MNMLQIPRRVWLTPGERLIEFEAHVQATGLQLSDLDRLNVVHVAGTKGKGSCCAFVESILRSQGFRTGFYSSPHILSVRERFRVNGVPISEDYFVDLFWRLHKCLCRFLTIMAFHFFLESKIDVAIIEVGVGGTYDSTNVVRNPVVCGITRLDYDHTNILGTTIEEIAWNKAGVLKRRSVAITVPQEKAAFEVISQRAKEVECALYVCQSWEDYVIPNDAEQLVLGIAGKHQLENASLALQLARMWAFRTGNGTSIEAASISLPLKGMRRKKMFFALNHVRKFILLIFRCFWPGRSQKVTSNGINFYLDGAHTPLSVQVWNSCCVEWFLSASSEMRKNPVRILVFHCTKGRQAKQLLPPLIVCWIDIVPLTVCVNRCGFQYALFSPPATASSDDPACGNLTSVCFGRYYHAVIPADVASLVSKREETEVAVNSHETAWLDLISDCPSCKTKSFTCVNDVYNFVKEIAKTVDANNERSVEVLVTGSLYLVGGFLSFLDPDLCGTIGPS